MGPIGLSVALALAGSFFVSLAVVASVGGRFLQEDRQLDLAKKRSGRRIC